MVKKEVKTDLDAVIVFINGANKEVKGKTISKLTNRGFWAEKHC